MPKPNFFIVGTPKAGTTSLYNYLEQHPEVFLPHLKEPHYFAYPEVTKSYYQAKFIAGEDEYLDLFSDAAESQTVLRDLSTSYLFNPNSAERIKAFNPEAKIIMVLRNPVERALSHYLMDRNLGLVDAPFKSILENRQAHKEHYEQYINRGIYDEQIKRYLRFFPKDQILILISDNLFENPEGVLKDVCRFLKISTEIEFNAERGFNQYKEARIPFINKMLQSEGFARLRRLLPEKLQDGLKGIFFKSASQKPAFEDEKRILRNLFEPSISRTEELLSMDLKAWTKLKVNGL